MSDPATQLKTLERDVSGRLGLIARSRQLIAHWRKDEQRIREQERERERSQPFVMFDAIELEQIPANAPAVAGYVGGRWPTFDALLVHFPHAKHLSIAVSAAEDAMCLDIEPGDATPQQAPAWVRRQQRRGIKQPVLYASLDTMPDVLAELKRAGMPRSSVRLWVAHYTFRAHIPPGYDACQWTDTALGRNLDESLCLPHFL